MRRYGNPPEKGVTHRIRPGAYAVILRGSDVLLTYQAAPHFEYQLPGGGIDPGENPIAALHREVLEETGWRISAPRRLGAYRRFTFMPDYGFHAEKICTIYMAQAVRCLGAPREEGHSAVWSDIGAASKLVASPGDQAFLAALG